MARRQPPRPSKRAVITERLIQSVFWFDRGRQAQVCMPNFTPPNWWECDVFLITGAGVWHEFEIKISLNDFHQDQKKAAHMPDLWSEHPEYRVPVDPAHRGVGGAVLPEHRQLYAPGLVLKHRVLADRKSPVGPQHYWYVVPEALIDAVKPHLPHHAGLLALWGGRSFGLKPVVQAPKRGAAKPGDKVKAKAMRSAYYRFWADRCKREKERRDECSRTDDVGEPSSGAGGAGEARREVPRLAQPDGC